MTVKTACLLSLAIHLVVFGSAIAFAQFSRGALWGTGEVITVSLFGSGSGPTGRISMNRKQGAVRSHTVDRGVGPSERTSPPVRAEAAARKQSDREEVLLAAVKDDRKKVADDAGYPGFPLGQKDAGSKGTGPGTQFGLISAEQWAVIESAIERSKSYPRLARERGIQGVAHVRFKLRTTGDVESVEIVKSSGYDILDTASIRTVYRAAPMPYVNGWVEVPMAYVLK
jgi:TonB family protein